MMLWFLRIEWSLNTFLFLLTRSSPLVYFGFFGCTLVAENILGWLGHAGYKVHFGRRARFGRPAGLGLLPGVQKYD